MNAVVLTVLCFIQFSTPKGTLSFIERGHRTDYAHFRQNQKNSLVPCLFSAGFSCIMVFFDSDSVISGCIRDVGNKLVKFEQSIKDPNVKHVVNIDELYIGNPCSLRDDKCSPSEVIHENVSMVLPTCCCKGDQCTSPDSYRISPINNLSISEKTLPFSSIEQLYFLAICYATTFTAITINIFMTLYNSYCNKVIVKNQ